MTYYKNLSGKSNVASYEIQPTSIEVTFKDGKSYLYSYASAGSRHVEMMKQLAVGGSGLNSYIIQHVKKLYERK